MDSFASWTRAGGIWFWPVFICFCAWLVRRYALSGNVDLSRGSARFSSRLSGVRPLHPIGVSSAQGSTASPRRFIAAVGRLRNLLLHAVSGSRAFDHPANPTETITVRARKMLGPQLQLVIVRAGHREYHVLSQPGSAAAVLSARDISEPKDDGLTRRTPNPRRCVLRANRHPSSVPWRHEAVHTSTNSNPANEDRRSRREAASRYGASAVRAH